MIQFEFFFFSQCSCSLFAFCSVAKEIESCFGDYIAGDLQVVYTLSYLETLE